MSVFGQGKTRKMLVAIDGSASGMHALKEAFRLAADEKSWITVVCVIPPYEGDLDSIGFGNIQHALRHTCEKALSDAFEAAKTERALIKTVCEEGVPYERIIDLAEAENCGLIVMGRRGLRRVERALVGSVTARVIGYGQKDVLVIPSNSTVGWQNILIATDGSRYSKIAASRAMDFAKAYGGSLAVLSIVDVPAEFYGEAPEALDHMIREAKGYTEQTRKEAEVLGLQAEIFVREGESSQVISEIAREIKASTIVMGSHGRTGLRRLLMGSVTEKVIGSASCPVLVVKA